MCKDKNGKSIVLRDYEANEVVGVQIGTLGHRLWVCIDGVAVLRLRAPKIDLEDMRIKSAKVTKELSRGA
jgi:hypothetical protein